MIAKSTKTKILLSGIQPSGKLHLGNYFGAMKQFVELQNSSDYKCFFPIVDLHTLTSLKDPRKLSENIIDVYLDYLAIGIDPNKSLVFQQSAAPQVTELAWILSTLITVPWLERAHAYKYKTAKGITPNVGLFTYPVLMAADMVIADADIVPVGEDQRQHIEMTREIVRKFNDLYDTNLLVEPQEMINDTVATVPGIDGAKMSKSYGNTIPLFASREKLQKLAMSVVTESTPKGESVDPKTNNIYQLYKLVATKPEAEKMAAGFRSGQLGFKDAKEMLSDTLDKFISPIRERRENIDIEKAKKQLVESSKIASDIYQQKIIEVKKTTGLIIKG
jgi:tryptophanyl-tRNA synthetase